MERTLTASGAASATRRETPNKIRSRRRPAEQANRGGIRRSGVHPARSRLSDIGAGLFKPVKLHDLNLMTGQLALMLDTGNTLVDSLDALANQATNPKLEQVLQTLSRDVSGGMPLATALEVHPQVFNEFYVATVRSAEASGALTNAFKRIEAHLQKREDVIANIRAALIYPTILATLATGAVIFLLTFVLPKFTVIFEKRGVQLPLPTRMLLGISEFCTTYWYLFPIVIIGGAVSIYMYAASERGKPVIHNLFLGAPIMGPLVKTLQTSQLLRMMGMLLDAGVPIVETLSIGAQACSNIHFRRLMARVTEGVLQGEGFARNFCKSRLFPVSIKQMVTTGERTGSMGLVMSKIADKLDSIADKQMKKISSLIEPLIIIVMGVAIGFIAIAILLPLFKLTSTLRGGH